MITIMKSHRMKQKKKKERKNKKHKFNVIYRFYFIRGTSNLTILKTILLGTQSAIEACPFFLPVVRCPSAGNY